jgi:hypothetical protein
MRLSVPHCKAECGKEIVHGGEIDIDIHRRAGIGCLDFGEMCEVNEGFHHKQFCIKLTPGEKRDI